MFSLQSLKFNEKYELNKSRIIIKSVIKLFCLSSSVIVYVVLLKVLMLLKNFILFNSDNNKKYYKSKIDKLLIINLGNKC